MQVELLTNGGYSHGMDKCVGKVFHAEQFLHGFKLPVAELKLAGFYDVMITSTLFFTEDEVRVIDG
jgi:hypothetical protein